MRLIIKEYRKSNTKAVSVVAGIKIFKYYMHLVRFNTTAHITPGPQHSLIKSKGQMFSWLSQNNNHIHFDHDIQFSSTPLSTQTKRSK